MNRRPHRRLRRIARVLFGVLPGLGILSFATAAHGEVPWRELTLAGAKPLGKVEIHLTLRHLPRETAAARLIASPEGRPIPPPAMGALELHGDAALEAVFLGRTVSASTISLTTDGTALQRVKLREGRKRYTKTYRFTEQGVYRLKVAPRDKQEAKQPRSAWTKVKKAFYPYAANTDDCRIVSEPTGLFYLLSANPAEGLEGFCFFFDDELHRLAIRPRGRETIAVDYVRDPATEAEHRTTGKIEALVVSVDKPAAPGKDEKPFEFLGLHGAIRFHLDPATRLPLRISGTAPGLGAVELHLSEAIH